MAMQTCPWQIGPYLDSQAAILHYLEAVFEDGDPALVTAALNDVMTASGVGPECSLKTEPSLAEAVDVLKRMGVQLAPRLPTSQENVA